MDNEVFMVSLGVLITLLLVFLFFKCCRSMGKGSGPANITSKKHRRHHGKPKGDFPSRKSREPGPSFSDHCKVSGFRRSDSHDSSSSSSSSSSHKWDHRPSSPDIPSAHDHEEAKHDHAEAAHDSGCGGSSWFGGDSGGHGDNDGCSKSYDD